MNFAKALSEELRPRNLSEIFAQENLTGENKALRNLIEQDCFYSLIIVGPPGCGKTSLAEIIAKTCNRPVRKRSALETGVKDIKEIIAASEAQLRLQGKAFLFFIDEIHRLSKNQQDVLLPSLEKGSIKLLGATTENPSFCLNRALLSRSLLFHFKALGLQDTKNLFARALKWLEEKGLTVTLDEKLLEELFWQSEGDARKALNLLQALISTQNKTKIHLSKKDLSAANISKSLKFERGGEDYYNTVSALIKSIRASDVDASLHYLARLLEGGVCPNYIARRLIIAASEDIGLANPHCLSFTSAGARAVEMIGMPEARIILAELCCLLASSPKSRRSYEAYKKAEEDVKKLGNLKIPEHLLLHRKIKSEKKTQELNLPTELESRKYYLPSFSGYEGQIARSKEEKRS